MTTISFELSKRLNDLGLLDNIETRYEYLLILQHKNSSVEPHLYETSKKEYVCMTAGFKYFTGWFKTLTLEEAIEFLIKQQITFINIIMPVTNNNYHTINSIRYLKNGKLGEIFIWGDEDGYTDVEIYGKTFLEVVEKMLEYLLDNNLLGQQ